MERSRNSNGFALTELLIGMVILVILLSAISTFLVPGISSTKYTMSQANSLSKARLALNRIVDIIEYNPRTVTFPVALGTLENELIFQDVDANVYDIAVTTDDFGKKSITVTKNSSVVERLAEGIVKDITFSLDVNNPNQIKVELTLNDASYAASPDVKLSTLVKMENM